MGNTTTATVVTPDYGQNSETNNANAKDRAIRLFQDYEANRFYYHNVQIASNEEGAAIVPLQSEQGQDRVVERLEQTTKTRKQNLKTILDVVREAGSIEEAVRDTDLFAPACQLGAYFNPKVGYLFDGTEVDFGYPILDLDTLDKITGRHDAELFLVEVELTY